MTNLANQGALFNRVEAALETLDLSVNPMDTPIFVEGRTSIEQLIADCEWMYFKFFDEHRSEIKRPDFVEETKLVWMYEKLNQVFKIDMGVTNFNMLHEISYGLNDELDSNCPQIKLGFIKYTDIEWIQQNNKLTPEHRNWFAFSGKYEKNGENFWFYHTHYPFWMPVPKYFSQKHGAFRELRVWRDEGLEKVCDIITDFERLFIDSGIPVRHSLLQNLGINDLVYGNKEHNRPKFGAEWQRTNARWGFRLDV